MRNIKTAVAVFICLVLNELFCWIDSIVVTDNIIMQTFNFIFVREFPIYPCSAAVIAMKSSVDRSVRKGISRVFSAAMGGVIGVIFFGICSYFTSSAVQIFFATLGVILCIHFCNILNHCNSAENSCVIFLIILITTGTNDPLIYATSRIIDTALGIGIAILVNRYLLSPSCIWRRRQMKTDPLVYESVRKLQD